MSMDRVCGRWWRSRFKDRATVCVDVTPVHDVETGQAAERLKHSSLSQTSASRSARMGWTVSPWDQAGAAGSLDQLAQAAGFGACLQQRPGLVVAVQPGTGRNAVRAELPTADPLVAAPLRAMMPSRSAWPRASAGQYARALDSLGGQMLSKCGKEFLLTVGSGLAVQDLR
jgi:hypothetical protein